VRFLWPAQRYDGLTRQSLVLAVALTTLGVVAISLPLVRHFHVAAGAASTDETVDTVALRSPITQSRTPAPTVTATHSSERSVVHRDPSSSHVDANPVLDTAGAVSPPSVPTSVGTPGSARPAAVGPASDQVGFTKPEGPRTIAAIPWRVLPPTAEEADSINRDQERRAAAARDDHRPMAIPIGGSIPFPLPTFGHTISKEQRLRDSIVHADNVQRLARLAERARRRRDSLLALGLGKAATDQRLDSATLRRPDRP
jgi:hypothetical protein